MLYHWDWVNVLFPVMLHVSDHIAVIPVVYNGILNIVIKTFGLFHFKGCERDSYVCHIINIDKRVKMHLFSCPSHVILKPQYHILIMVPELGCVSVCLVNRRSKSMWFLLISLLIKSFTAFILNSWHYYLRHLVLVSECSAKYLTELLSHNESES